MSKVFVVDTNKQPLNPIHPGRARLLLSQGKAAVFRRYPFTLVLKSAGASSQVEPLRVKLDPGSRVTGLAIVNDASGEVIFAAELAHRGQAIKIALDARRAVRRSRRQRKTRYRQARYAHRRKPKGWLPPSLESRLANVMTWLQRLRRCCSITAISMELVKFDLQQMENSAISGVEYQQGTLAGYEVREYLLEQWGRRCAYCGVKDVPLQIEHIHPRAKRGTNRISNLTLACEPCNSKKGIQDVRVFLANNPDVLKRILAQTKAPLTDAAAVNIARWTLFERLKALGMPIECGSGGLTRFNRTMRGLPKEHWMDAACVGKSTPEHLQTTGVVPLLIMANGYGNRQMCLMDKRGFPRTRPKQLHCVKGYRTGDIVKAVVTEGKKVGTYVGRVAVRASGFFNITTGAGTIEGINHRYCHLIYRVDGYSYQFGRRAAFPPVT